MQMLYFFTKMLEHLKKPQTTAVIGKTMNAVQKEPFSISSFVSITEKGNTLLVHPGAI